MDDLVYHMYTCDGFTIGFFRKKSDAIQSIADISGLTVEDVSKQLNDSDNGIVSGFDRFCGQSMGIMLDEVIVR